MLFTKFELFWIKIVKHNLCNAFLWRASWWLFALAGFTPVVCCCCFWAEAPSPLGSWTYGTAVGKNFPELSGPPRLEKRFIYYIKQNMKNLLICMITVTLVLLLGLLEGIEMEEFERIVEKIVLIQIFQRIDQNHQVAVVWYHKNIWQIRAISMITWLQHWVSMLLLVTLLWQYCYTLFICYIDQNRILTFSDLLKPALGGILSCQSNLILRRSEQVIQKNQNKSVIFLAAQLKQFYDLIEAKGRNL